MGFDAFYDLDVSVLVQVCHYAMQEKYSVACSDIFIDGVAAKTMRYILSGKPFYTTTEGGLFNEFAVECDVWISELANWVKWVHAGHLRAGTVVFYIDMDTTIFRGILVRDGGKLWKYLRVFAVFFVAYAEDACQQEDVIITDMPLPTAVVDRLIKKTNMFEQLSSMEAADSSLSMLKEGNRHSFFGHSSGPW